jgi:hypothetical protein
MEEGPLVANILQGRAANRGSERPWGSVSQHKKDVAVTEHNQRLQVLVSHIKHHPRALSQNFSYLFKGFNLKDGLILMLAKEQVEGPYTTQQWESAPTFWVLDCSRGQRKVVLEKILPLDSKGLKDLLSGLRPVFFKLMAWNV